MNEQLVQSIPDLQVFTPGKNFISPFVFNPFVPPKDELLRNQSYYDENDEDITDEKICV